MGFWPSVETNGLNYYQCRLLGLSMQQYYGLCSLEIGNVRREDAGVYTVTATSPRGTITCSATLDVQSTYNVVVSATSVMALKHAVISFISYKMKTSMVNNLTDFWCCLKSSETKISSRDCWAAWTWTWTWLLLAGVHKTVVIVLLCFNFLRSDGW